MSSKEYMLAYMSKRYARRRQALIELMGGRCKCGSDYKLHFHHREPNEKLFSICGPLAGGKWETILEELKKCDLLCEACHLEEHARRSRAEAQRAASINM
jgi:hypothetical protein